MAKEQRKEELRQAAMEKMPSPIIVLAYMEHYLDLVGKLVKDLSTIVDETKITSEIQARLDLLDLVLAQSSIDFENLESPLESYKIPNTADIKHYVAKTRQRYMAIQAEEGLLE